MAGSEQWIGKTETQEEVLAPEPAARMAALMDYNADSRHWDPGRALPPLWHWVMFPEVARLAELGRDGHATLGEFLPPVPLPRRMWAGGRIRMSAPLLVGECIRRRSTITAVTEKQGRTGPLVFVTVEHAFSVDGEHRLTEEHDIVYRDDLQGDAAPAKGERPPEGADWSRMITPTSVMLFQYSALTYNGHRIHYDVDYCRDVEGYPGLVVHGPLTATLLAQLALENMPGRSLASFSFKAMRPLFDLAPFEIRGRQDGDEALLWAVDPQGYVAMTAKTELHGQ